MDIETINLYNAAKASATAADVDAALRAQDAKTELRKIIVDANEQLRARLADKKTPTSLRQLAEQLDANEDDIAVATAIRAKAKRMRALQDIIMIRWELERTDVSKLNKREDGKTAPEEMDVDDEEHDDSAMPALIEYPDDAPKELAAMDTAGLMDKAEEMGIAQHAIEAAMEHADDDLRQAKLVELIMNPELAEVNKLSDEQRTAILALKVTGLSKLRKHLAIPQGVWAQAVTQKDCVSAMRQLITEHLEAKEPEQINEALATATGTARKDSRSEARGQQPGLDTATDDTPKQIAEALVAAAKQELMRAKGSTAGKEGHIASAKMLKTVIESGGGLPAPRASKASLGNFDQDKFKTALAASDRQTWTQMLADRPELMHEVLQQTKGSSETIKELIEAAKKQTPQGTSLTAWVDREPVSEPPSDWEGVGPRVKSAKIPKKFRNIFLPLQFDRERDFSISELLDDVEDESDATRYDTDAAKELKTEEAYKKLRKKHVFKTLSEFRDAVDRLEHYCAHTQPAILPPMSEELEQHRVYVRGLINEMRTAGVDEDPVIMKLYVLYDEEIRARRAKHTVHTAWTDEFAKIRKTFLTTPLRAHERKQKVETEGKMKRLAEQLSTLAAKKARTTEATHKNAGAWNKLQHIPGAKKEHLLKNGKQVCFGHSKKAEGCTFAGCRFSHHCIKCGGDHPAQKCKAGD